VFVVEINAKGLSLAGQSINHGSNPSQARRGGALLLITSSGAAQRHDRTKRMAWAVSV
jgi:hypothetical protein